VIVPRMAATLEVTTEPRRIVRACIAWSAAGALLLTSACSESNSNESPAPVGMAGAESAAAGASNAAAGASASLPPAAGSGGANAAEGNPPIAGGLDTAGGATSAGAAGAPAIDATPAVRFVGRFDTTDPAGPRFAWSGSGMLARFSGASVGIRLAGAQQYTVLIDGALQPKLTSTGNLDPLASDLAPGEHTVEVYRRTEANQGEAQFLGFDFGAGQLLAPPPAPERRIEIIGDSISCGYGVEGADMTCPFSPDTENHSLTYGAIAARNVGADLVTVAWSGKGVVCNYGDDATACTDPMPTYYDRILPARADSAWSFANYQPQAVVINLGTNDFSTAVDPTTADFEAAYVALLEHVRSEYADATILCTIGPLLSGTDLTTVRTSIDNAVQARAAQGDTKVKTFELEPTDPANGYGCDYHPSSRTHEIMADALTAELRADLGW
jgi:lysophospholipase L1-like esterase